MYLWAIYKSLKNTWMYELGTRPRSFISGNTSMGFSVQCILGYKVKHGVLSLQDIRRWVISSERGGGLLITLAIHLKQNLYFGNLCKKYLFVRMPPYHSSVKLTGHLEGNTQCLICNSPFSARQCSTFLAILSLTHSPPFLLTPSIFKLQTHK